MTLPKMRLAHMGITVKNLCVMEAFYTEVLGFKASDRGVARGSPMVFLTRDPSDHHQIVFQEQRKTDETTINQISFQLDDLSGLREMRGVLFKAQVEELKFVDHCVACSIYCHDPDGNRLGFFVDGPFYVKQPMIQDLQKSLVLAYLNPAIAFNFWIKQIPQAISRGRCAWPPPKLDCCGALPPRVTRTAQYLNSGILPTGSSTGLVSLLAAAS